MTGPKYSRTFLVKSLTELIQIKRIEVRDKMKVGTKVKNIKLVHDSGDGHDIACKIDGFGAMNLKSEFVKKV